MHQELVLKEIKHPHTYIYTQSRQSIPVPGKTEISYLAISSLSLHIFVLYTPLCHSRLPLIFTLTGFIYSWGKQNRKLLKFDLSGFLCLTFWGHESFWEHSELLMYIHKYTDTPNIISMISMIIYFNDIIISIILYSLKWFLLYQIDLLELCFNAP